MKNNILALLAFLSVALLPLRAEAATKFWVGGTGNWSDTTHWATSSGGAGSTGVPANGDSVTVDSNSGSGTITVDTAGAIPSTGAFTTISMSSSAITLDLSVNNNNVFATSFASSGTTVQSLKIGTGTWTLSGTSGNLLAFANTANFTCVCGSGTFTLNGTISGSGPSISLDGSGAAIGTLNLGAQSANGRMWNINQAGQVGTININAPNNVCFTNTTLTVTTAVNIVSPTSSNPVFLGKCQANAFGGISVPASGLTAQWVASQGITYTGAGAVSLTNSFDLGGNSGATISPPSGGGGGGGGYIIGGG